MRKFVAFAAMFVFATAFAEVGHVESYAAVRDVVYQITTEVGSGSCSAVAVAPKQLLTAKHCHEPLGEVVVVKDQNLRVVGKATFVREAEDTDLALYTTDFDLVVVAAVAEGNPAVDTRVVAVGFPLGLGQFVTTGLVQFIDEDGYIMASANAIFGNSGGGLFATADGGYVLVGIASSVAVTRAGVATYITAWVDTAHIIKFLK